MARRHYSSSAAATTLSSSVGSSDTTMTVGSITGLPVQYPYTLILDPDTASEEVVDVTAGTGTNLTVTRGVDGTTALAHTSGAVVQHGVSARDFDEPNAHVAATSGVHGASGTVVGTSDTQALTNKDLSSATNTFPASHPRGVLGYEEVTTNQTGISNADLTGLSVTVTAGTGRRLRVTVSASLTQSGVAATTTLSLVEGPTVLQQAVNTIGGAGFHAQGICQVVLTPSAGAHTYKAVLATNGGTVGVDASATQPAFILVEDLGAA